MNLKKLITQAALLVFLVILIGWWPMSRQRGGGYEAALAMLYSGLMCLVVGIISLAPLKWAAKVNREMLAQICLACTIIRLLLTLCGGLVVYWLLIEPGQRFVFAVWTLVFYMLLLVWETITAVRMIRVIYSRPTATETG